MYKPLVAALAAALLAGCASTAARETPRADAAPPAGFTDDPYPSTYAAIASPPGCCRPTVICAIVA